MYFVYQFANMKPLLFTLSFFLAFGTFAQKREELFNFSFEPSQSGPYYYVSTEKKDSGWYREAFYISQKTMAMKGWYKDKEAKVKHGPFTYYHFTRFISSQGNYVNNKKNGLWLEYDEKGMLTDSSIYKKWKSQGYLTTVAFKRLSARLI